MKYIQNQINNLTNNLCMSICEVGLFEHGKELSYEGYKRQPVTVEVENVNDEIKIYNKTEFRFDDIDYEGKKLDIVFLDKENNPMLELKFGFQHGCFVKGNCIIAREGSCKFLI